MQQPFNFSRGDLNLTQCDISPSKRHNAGECVTAILVALLIVFVGLVRRSDAVDPHITIDGSLENLGGSGPREFTSPDIEIGADLGVTRGSAVFHSFGRFNVPANGRVTFTGPDSIANILSRVTGGEISNIDGMLRSTIPGANLFLLNPAGIIFGPGARLDIKGSFLATTGNALQFADGSLFFADPSLDGLEASILRVAPAEAFGFLNNPTTDDPTAVTFTTEDPSFLQLTDGSLRVPSGESLTLIGGNLTIEGPAILSNPSLHAPNGKVNLASVRSDGTVSLTDSNGSTAFDLASFDALGEVTIDNQAFVQTIGNLGSGQPAGTVVIRGGKLMIDNRSHVIGSTLSNLDAAPVAIDVDVASSITVDHSSTISSTNAGGGGDAGAIQLTSKNLIVSHDAQINSFFNGNGDAADLIIRVDNLLLTSGGGISAANNGFQNRGDGSLISLRADQEFIIDPGSIIEAKNFRGFGAAPVIEITTPLLRIGGGLERSGISGETGGNGPASRVTLSVSRLELLENGSIDTRSRNFSLASVPPQLGGGDITIQGIGGVGTSADTVLIQGEGAGFKSSTEGKGPGGNIHLTARTVMMSEQGKIAANTTNAGAAGIITLNVNAFEANTGSRIESNTSSKGDGGEITFQGINGTGTLADTISINGQDSAGKPSGLFSTAISQGSGGSIFLSGRNVTISDKGTLSATSSDNVATSGSAGTISVMGTETVNLAGAEVTTQTAGGAGGAIAITGGDLVSLTEGTRVTAESTGAGVAGSVTLTATNSTIALRGSTVESSAGGTGAGGSVALTADAVTITDGATVTAASTNPDAEAGEAGTITITAPQSYTQAGSTVTTTTAGGGTGGDIAINSGTIVLQPGTVIAAQSTGSGTTAGNGGTIAMTAQSSLTAVGANLSAEAQDAAGGDIVIMAAQQNVSLFSDTVISVSTAGLKDAGSINLTAGDTIMIDESSILTAADKASGGDIKLTAPNLIWLRNNALISGSVAGGTETLGANIDIDSQFILVQGSQILAKAFQGTGGNIQLTGEVILVDPFSEINASSAFGVDGSIDIQAPIQNLSGTIAPLPQRPANVATMYSARCAAQKNGKFSSLVLGQNKLPPPPGNFLASPLTLRHADHPPSQTGGSIASQRFPFQSIQSDMTLSFKERAQFMTEFTSLLNGCSS